MVSLCWGILISEGMRDSSSQVELTGTEMANDEIRMANQIPMTKLEWFGQRIFELNSSF
jgi:hypothetical protein